MEYTFHKQELSDIPIKTQVAIHVIVSGLIEKPSLERLLNDLYITESQKTGFRYRKFLTHIFIYLYVTEAHANSGYGQWIAMLKKVGADEQPQISFNERQLENLDSPAEDKFGRTEAERPKIFKEVILAERKATKEADEYYPLDSSSAEQVGQSLVLKRQTPLTQSIAVPSNQGDLVDSIQNMKILEPGTHLLVAQTQKVRDISWYLVEARTQEGDFIDKGWINGIALMGQTYVSGLDQIQDNQGIKNNLVDSYKEKLAKDYNLAREQLDQIVLEALTKDWSFPAST